MKKNVIAFLTMVLVLFVAMGVCFSEDSETFSCYFEKNMFMRAQPGPGNNIKTIPAYTVVTITPVTDKYASVTYDGVTGYVFYTEAKNLQTMENETELTKTVFSTGNKYVFQYPLPDTAQIGTISMNTPIYVTADAGKYYRIEYNGSSAYIHKRDTQDIPADKAITPKEIYTKSAEDVKKYPLSGSENVYSTEPGQIYMASAECNGFFKISWGISEGYIKKSDALSFSKDNTRFSICIVKDNAMLYEKPYTDFASAQKASSQQYFIDGDNNGFYHLQKLNLYVRHEDVQAWNLEKIALCQLYPKHDVNLVLYPGDNAPAIASTIVKEQVYQSAYRTGDYYLINTDGVLGFVNKNEVSTLLLKEKMNLTAAIVNKDTLIYCQDGTNQQMKIDDKLFIEQSADDFYYCTTITGLKGYVLGTDVKIIGSDAPVDKYNVKLQSEIDVYDFPDSRIRTKTASISADSVVTVTGFNRCYLKVSSGEITGYANQDGLISGETAGIPIDENVPNYQLVLDKSTRNIYVFVLDSKGERTDEIAASATVAIGKRTTPTPSGTFMLGFKERWHKFRYSSTPHTTTYTDGKFIHGLPCQTRSESTVIDYMAHQSGRAVTGGCLRSPLEFARWVYFNCPSYKTQLIIVNGGFVLPEEKIGNVTVESDTGR